jgi:hypothetical protein
METLVYFSRNSKKPPFEVLVALSGQRVSINCNCALGIEKKICRHKINAIRGDKENRHDSTSDETIARLRGLFGMASTLRQHLEEKWRLLRQFASENPDQELEVDNKRRILGEVFANGFLNEYTTRLHEPFDVAEWEDARQIYAAGFKCPSILKYVDHEGVESARQVLVEEVFISNARFYLLGYCSLRMQKRTFRVDRIQGISFPEECNRSDVSKLLDVVFQGNPS